MVQYKLFRDSTLRSTGVGYSNGGHRFDGRKSGSFKMENGYRPTLMKRKKKGQEPDLEGVYVCVCV